MNNQPPFFMMVQPGGGFGNLSQENLTFLSMNDGIHGAYIANGPNFTLQRPHPNTKPQLFDNHPDGRTTMTKQERAEMYRSYLAEEGYVPKIDSDGDVAFKCEGRTYVILIDPDDDTFFNIALPCFWSIESEEERAKVAHAAQYATAHTKVAKIYPTKDNTIAAVEMFCSPPEAFKAVFERAIRALQSSVMSFRNKMNEEQH